MSRDIDRWTFQVYVTDTLQAIAENTAIPAAGFTNGEAGRAMTRRWIERNKPIPPADTRTAEQVIDHVLKKLEEMREN